MRCSTISPIAVFSILDAIDPETGICKDLIHGNPADSAKKQDDQCAARPALPDSRSPHSASEWTANGFARESRRTSFAAACVATPMAKSSPSRLVLSLHRCVHRRSAGKTSEVSTSDCIWLLAASLTCRQFFHEDHEIVDLATLLYSRYDFPWMTNGNGKLLSHGWKPEGFLKARYEKYCQLAAMYLLGSARPPIRCRPKPGTHGSAIPTRYGQYNYIGTSLLWTYQYPFAWFDFRGRRENQAARPTGGRTAKSPRARTASGATPISPKSFPTIPGDHLGHHQFVQPQRIQGLGWTARPLAIPTAPSFPVLPAARS